MSTLKLAAAIGLASLLAMSNAVQAGPDTRGPSTRIDQGGGSSDGDVLVEKGPLTINPYSLKCFPSDDMYNGLHEIWIKNTGTETIPPTFWITITWPDGTQFVYTVTVPLKPGDALGANVPAEHFKQPFKCGAKLSLEKP